MAAISLGEFADKVSELMPVLSRQFLKYQTSDFYKMKITMPQFVLMDVLQKHNESRMTDLAGYMSVTTAAITGIVDRLVRDGYIVRMSDSEDRRIVRVKLTPKGNAIVQKACCQRKSMMMDMFGMITQKEREEYLSILEHMSKHISKETH